MQRTASLVVDVVTGISKVVPLGGANIPIAANVLKSHVLHTTETFPAVFVIVWPVCFHRRCC